MTTKKQTTVIEVLFKDSSHRAHFSSLKAIYNTFSRAELGVSLKTLQNGLVKLNSPYENRRVLISRFPLHSSQWAKNRSDE